MTRWGRAMDGAPGFCCLRPCAHPVVTRLFLLGELRGKRASALFRWLKWVVLPVTCLCSWGCGKCGGGVGSVDGVCSLFIFPFSSSFFPSNDHCAPMLRNSMQ